MGLGAWLNDKKEGSYVWNPRINPRSWTKNILHHGSFREYIYFKKDKNSCFFLTNEYFLIFAFWKPAILWLLLTLLQESHRVVLRGSCGVLVIKTRSATCKASGLTLYYITSPWKIIFFHWWEKTMGLGESDTILELLTFSNSIKVENTSKQ